MQATKTYRLLKTYNYSVFFTLIWLIVCVFLALTSNAQGNSLNGIIKDDKTLEPLDRVTIELHTVADSMRLFTTLTNHDGLFNLDKIQPGNYYILVKSVSYQPVIVDDLHIDNKNNTIYIGVIMLKAAISTLQTVVISAAKSIMRSTIDKQVFKADQFLSAKGGTAMDVLKNLPSVTVNGFGEISLRGSSGIQVQLNGKQVQGDINVI